MKKKMLFRLLEEESDHRSYCDAFLTVNDSASILYSLLAAIPIMKFLCLALVLTSTSAFVPSFDASSRSSYCRSKPTSILSMGTEGLDLTGNSWKPDSSKMGSTDTGDYYPEGYDPNQEIAFTEGMKGSQAMLGGGDRGVELPGMDFSEGGFTIGGIDAATEIPNGMLFIPSSVPDGEVVMNVASSSSGLTVKVEVSPVCMTFEDYFAAFSPDSHPSLSVSPVTGRMDRRGGEKTILNVNCNPNGQAGEFVGNLVINLPEDNSKICYRIIAKCF